MRRRQFFGLVGGALADGIVRPPAVGENSIRIGKFESWPQLAVAPSMCSAEPDFSADASFGVCAIAISHSDCNVTSLIPVKCVCRMDNPRGMRSSHRAVWQRVGFELTSPCTVYKLHKLFNDECLIADHIFH
jgi:hypothetical protein